MTTIAITEGKTKVIVPDKKVKGEADIVAKNDITAGDGAKRDSFPDKGVCATETTSNVFRLLKTRHIPIAFISHVKGSVVFRAQLCTMLPYEVVIRRIALGSYLKRNPDVPRGTRFPELIVEFYLKTSGKSFRGISVPKDDPFVSAFLEQGGIFTRRADLPTRDPETEFVKIPAATLYPLVDGVYVPHPYKKMETLALKVFQVLEEAWAKQNCTLADLKIEFGYTQKGKLVVADVIDNDSWRLFDENGEHLDKQRYRDGASIEEVAALYRNVMERTKLF